MAQRESAASNKTHSRRAQLSGHDFYEIRVEGHLGSNWSSWFEELSIRHDASGETILSGLLADQSALHGVLMKIRDLGLTLIAVHRVQHKE